MARPIWTGAITFGLVSVPVAMHSATHEQRCGSRRERERALPSGARWCRDRPDCPDPHEQHFCSSHQVSRLRLTKVAGRGSLEYVEPVRGGENTDIEIVAGDRAGTSVRFHVRQDGQIHRFATTVDLQQWLQRHGLDLAQLVAPSPDEDGCE